ncbi:hypothetical protein SK128_006658 [Halocaridina rubra]|uniref:Uncharacterized protein n=1 Tax=Halocaridina rubra TaxID=373956 RepID=A0AAN8ZYI1_HALRR
MNWMDSFCQEILKEGGNNSPSEEIARLWRETIEEAKRIYEDLVYDRLIVSYEAMERLMRDEFVRTTVGALQSLWHKVHEVHMKIHEWIPRMVSSLKYQFETLTRVTNGVVYGGIQWMKTGEMPEEMRRLFDMMIESSLLHRLMRSSEELLQEYPEVYEMLIQILEKMKITLVRDLEMVREDLMAMPRVEEMVNWLLKHLRLDDMIIYRVELLINKIVQESLLSSVKLTHGRLEIQIPLRRPVNSLIEALKYIEPNPIPVPANVLRLYETLTLRMVDYWIWSYYSFLPKHARYLVPPYNRTAMLVDGKEILTFDGSVLRAPVSPCKILLAAYKSNEVIMEHPRSSEVPEILMKTRWG